MKSIYWTGNSRQDIRNFPNAVKEEAGLSLQKIQYGHQPANVSPLTELGKGISGVLEIIIDSNKETYRVVYVAKLQKGIYVLHAFHKKSKSGISIPQKDKDTIIRRYKLAREQDSS